MYVDEQSERYKKMMNTRRAALWIQYMELVDILSKSINTERTGNWHMYLQAVKDMLPSLQHLVTPSILSAYIYLQFMLALPETHPELHRNLKRLSCGEEE